MVRIKPFRGIRPPKEHAAEVASRPYDVLNSAEAKAEAGERSLLHIIKPEIDFDPIADEHAEEVYDRAVENFCLWRERGWLQQDEEEQEDTQRRPSVLAALEEKSDKPEPVKPFRSYYDKDGDVR